MPWNPWIAVEPDNTTNEAVQQLYQRTRDKSTGRPPDVVRLGSLAPAAAGLLYDLQRTVYNGAEGLTLREKEISALIVSVYNGCVH